MAAPTDSPRATGAQIFNNYQGAFRFWLNNGGNLTTAYQRGGIAVVPGGASFYSDGHVYGGAVAQFSTPILSTNSDPNQLNMAPVLQTYVTVYDKGTRRYEDGEFTWLYGMYASSGGKLYVNAVNFYDTVGYRDMTLVFDNASTLATGPYSGYYGYADKRRLANYISPIPVEWQSILGGTHLMGNGAGMSVRTSYSNGPSLYAVNLADLTGEPKEISATKWLEYPVGHELSSKSLGYPTAGTWDQYNQQGYSSGYSQTNDMWTEIDAAQYGFIVPGTRTFAVIGHKSCLTSQCGYKITQSNGNVCGGPCPYDPDDYHPYYWLFDLAEIVNATNSYDVEPYEYGELSVPYDTTGADGMPSGGTFDPTTGKLYILLQKAYKYSGQGAPVVLVYGGVGNIITGYLKLPPGQAKQITGTGRFIQ